MSTSDEKLQILLDWVKSRRKEGYSIDQITKYLKTYNYNEQQIEYILSATTAQLTAEKENQKVVQHEEPAAEPPKEVHKEFHEKLSPEDAKAFFMRIHLLISSPRLFFTHLYTSPTMKGLRMMSFSVLLALTLGSLFWTGYYASNIFLIVPDWLKTFINPFVTAKIFLLFALMLLVFQPLYYFIIHLHSSYLDARQYFGGLLFGLTPFITFSTVPGLNIVGILLSLHLIDVAFKSYYNASDRSLFDVSVVYALGLGIISLAISLIYATSSAPIAMECVTFPDSTPCEINQLAFDTLEINGVPNSPIIVADNDNREFCYGSTPSEITCDTIVGTGAYYFYGNDFTGAFSIV